jgi:roadblock/LC7 domain-containing protein
MTDSGAPPPPPSPPPPPPPTPPPPGPSGPPPYPVVLEFARGDEVARWRPLVNWLLAIPQFVVVYLLGIIERVLGILSLFFVLFTKRIPDSIFNFRVMVYRYQWRVTSFAFFMRDEYPPFSFELTAIDDEIDEARLSIQPPGEMNRWLPLVKWLLAIPHYVVLAFLGIGVFFVWIITFFAVIITGRYPRGLRDFVVGVSRWAYRVTAYVLFMTDEYPPFSLS